jgi:hypothetical protein
MCVLMDRNNNQGLKNLSEDVHVRLKNQTMTRRRL